MKRIFPLILGALAGLSAPLAHAWSYNNGDVLLIFRNAESSTYDVEYDIGNVSQFLGHTNGYTTAVTGWNPADVLGVLGGQNGPGLTGINVALLATTSLTNATPTAWVTGIEPNTYAYSDNVGDWDSSYYLNISTIGNKPVTFDVPTADTNAYSISPSGRYKYSSYEYILDGGGSSYLVSQLGGNVPFVVEQTIPGSLDFWAVQPLESGGVAPADKYVGSFVISTNGVLTFTAGPQTPAITGVTRSGNLTAVGIPTTVGVHYQLVGTSQLGVGASWSPIGSVLTGDGNTDVLTETNATAARFYRVTAQ
jgi:hypothetical protein